MKKYIQEHKYVLLVLYLPIYLIWFALVERMVPSTEGCFVSYLPLDDKIPFLPGFILAYVLWYPFLIIPVVVTLLKDDRRAFIRYAAFIIAGFSISLTICMIWPNCQLLRPSDVDTSTLCGWLVNAIYSADTPTNVLPSMHVVGCMAVLAVTFDSKYLKKVRVPAVIIAVAICAATVFVKQHSILDVFAALALSLVLYLIIYVAARRAVDRRQPSAAA
jgi:membrane-associated phospholipid phosphatase